MAVAEATGRGSVVLGRTVPTVPGNRYLRSLAREFCRIIRQRDAAAWLRWRDAAPASPLANFAKHLCRDEEAVLAALQQ
jgi:hypothetical protein